MHKILGLPEFKNQEDQRRANILVVSQFLVFFIVIAVMIFSYFTAPEHTETIIQGGLGLAAMLISYLILRRGDLETAAWIVAMTGWFIFTLDLAVIAGIRGVNVLGQILMVIFAGFVISGRSALVLTLITLAANLGILQMENLGLLEEPMPLEANVTRWFIQSAYTILAAVYIWTADNVIKSTLSQLKETADQYKSLFDLTSDAVVMISLDWKIISVNKKALQLFGYSEPEFIGLEVNRWEDFEDPELMENRRVQLLSGKALPPFEEVLTIKNGSKINVEMSLALVHDGDGQPLHIQCIMRDITKRKEYEQQLEQQALYDPLTNLPNRILFEDRYQLAHSTDERDQSLVAVLFVDLDNFKKVNDEFGHAVGDQVLMKLGERLKTTLRDRDTVARLGGDEFVIILEDIRNKDDITMIARKIQHNISQPMRFEEQQIEVTASIGINVSEKNKMGEIDLVRTSDTAMYQVKEEGKNDIRFYEADR
jgi:diguanylate cyclase (GGDEF)-like protein/PAS domain S-box-containing protein